MAVLKDMHCTSCGAANEALVDGETTSRRMRCPACRELTKHVSRCTGGLGKRYRYADWSGYDTSNEIRFARAGVTAYNSDGTEAGPAYDPKAGCNIEDMPKFKDADRLAERRDKAHRKYARARGKGPITLDLGSK